MKTAISGYIKKLCDTVNSLDYGEIENCAEVLDCAAKNGKYIYIIGNGGSAATASHFVCDFNKGLNDVQGKRNFKFVCLNDNISTIMSLANDSSYDDIFVEQLKNFIEKGDVLLAISGSGNSKNIIKAVEYANSVGAVTIGFTGYDGGELKKRAKYSVNANVDNMEISEDIHVILCHLLKTVLSEKQN
ncbi:MAG: SIS domain-containing protein [Candidatus Gastranaerophilales bacterium]|nr:SIS domain-containing protein [Candidatus Gastranaerophilales bacterium]